MLIDALLVFLGPTSQRIAVMVEQSVATKLTHHQRLLILRFPLQSIGFLRQPIVPADVLVTAKHVEKLTQWIVDHLRSSVEIVAFHRRRH